jgi:hypothetical protein
MRLPTMDFVILRYCTASLNANLAACKKINKTSSVHLQESQQKGIETAK